MHTANRGVTLGAGPHRLDVRRQARQRAVQEHRRVSACRWDRARHRLVRICQITFADRYKLLVTDGNAFALPHRSPAGGLPRLHARPACSPRRARRRPRRATDRIHGGNSPQGYHCLAEGPCRVLGPDIRRRPAGPIPDDRRSEAVLAARSAPSLSARCSGGWSTATRRSPTIRRIRRRSWWTDLKKHASARAAARRGHRGRRSSPAHC